LSIIAAPLAGASSIYQFFSLICHQDPARSWQILGEPLPVCIRCVSIYFGFLVSLWLGFPASVRRLQIAMLLIFAEFVIARSWTDAALLRSVSGIVAGTAAAPFVRKGIEEIRESM
jgi:uncharacterized membrane protein